MSLISNINQAFQLLDNVNLSLITREGKIRILLQDNGIIPAATAHSKLFPTANFFFSFFLQLNFHLEKQSDGARREPLLLLQYARSRRKSLQPGYSNPTL